MLNRWIKIYSRLISNSNDIEAARLRRQMRRRLDAKHAAGERRRQIEEWVRYRDRVTSESHLPASLPLQFMDPDEATRRMHDAIRREYYDVPSGSYTGD